MTSRTFMPLSYFHTKIWHARGDHIKANSPRILEGWEGWFPVHTIPSSQHPQVIAIVRTDLFQGRHHATTDHHLHRTMERSAARRTGPEGRRMGLSGARPVLLGQP